MSPIQFFRDGVEYTTRYELACKYPHVGHNRLQRLLEGKDVTFIQYKNTFFFEKASTEQLVESKAPAPTPLTDEQRLDRAFAKLAALGEGAPAAPANELETTTSPESEDSWM